MGVMTVIPATIRPANTSREETKDNIQKIKVAAYCRVSTDTDEQASSYETQINHYTDYISQHPNWELAGIYADDGISATNTKKRVEFNKMIDACMEGRIDLVITKSISRFARNTLDCLKYVRMLKERQIPVLFEKENINTCDSKGEVMLTIMASLAQQESESISKNVKMGLRYRYQQGKIQINHRWFLGYTKDSEGKLVIVPKEAEIVKRIYREYLNGSSLVQIKKSLEADGIPNGAGHLKWGTNNIQQILTNEKYIGDALLQKTITIDILNKKRIKNDGRDTQYYIKDNHEAIISRDIFDMVQEGMEKRKKIIQENGNYSGRTILANIITCACCGKHYQTAHWYVRGHRIVWRCITRLKNGRKADCTNRTVSDEKVKSAVIEAINKFLADKADVIARLQDDIKTGIITNVNCVVKELDNKIEALQQQLIHVMDEGRDGTDILEQLDILKKQRAELFEEKIEERAARQKRLLEYLMKQDGQIDEYDDILVRRLVEKIVIGEKKIAITLKTGVVEEIMG